MSEQAERNAGAIFRIAQVDDGTDWQREVDDFLYGLIRLLKPLRIVGCGRLPVRRTAAAGNSLRDNGFGEFLDWSASVCEASQSVGPANSATRLSAPAARQTVYFISSHRIQSREFASFYEQIPEGSIVVLQDVDVDVRVVPVSAQELSDQGKLSPSPFPSPDGIVVGRVQRGHGTSRSSLRESMAGNSIKGSSTGLSGRKAILVLGAHRSGTSSLARLLNLLGADLPIETLGASHGNPLGHWEPIRLLKLNNEILASLGLTWSDPRPVPLDWFRSKEAYRYHQRLVNEIRGGYRDSGLIVIKEPRICRLAPLYLEALDALAIEPVVILPIRHPAEVVRSIEMRDQLDRGTVELLWLRSLIEAENATRDCKRFWTSFDGLLEDWKSTVCRIAERTGITWPKSIEEVAGEAAELLRPRHRHHRFGSQMTGMPLSPLTMKVWEAAQRGVAGEEEGARAGFDAVRAPIWELDRLSSATSQQLQLKMQRADEFARNCSKLPYQLRLVRQSIANRLARPVDRLLHRSAKSAD